MHKITNEVIKTTKNVYFQPYGILRPFFVIQFVIKFLNFSHRLK